MNKFRMPEVNDASFDQLVSVIKPPRIRVLKSSSKYNEMLGEIIRSNTDGTFCVIIQTEGDPEIDLLPTELEPCEHE